MSLPEKMLWSRLRAKRMGFTVRRQYPHGPYIMDFYAHELLLCIEIDGASHESREIEDSLRCEYMKIHGITTIRIPAKRILEDVDDVAEGLYHSFCERSGRDPLGLRNV
jgi:very-short-patch-repair endonuclease